jgi:hypothetical protein
MDLRVVLTGLALCSQLVAAVADPLPTWRWEDANELERRAYSCSALLTILTATSATGAEEMSFSKQATLSASVLGLIAGSQTSLRLQQPVNRGYVFHVRDSEMTVWSARWKSDDQKRTFDSAEDCLGWSADVATKVQIGSIKQPGEATYAGPYHYRSFGREKLEALVRGAFEAWAQQGSLTPSAVKEMLKRGP